MKKGKILFCSSAGGHYSELLQLGEVSLSSSTICGIEDVTAGPYKVAHTDNINITAQLLMHYHFL